MILETNGSNLTNNRGYFSKKNLSKKNILFFIKDKVHTIFMNNKLPIKNGKLSSSD